MSIELWDKIHKKNNFWKITTEKCNLKILLIWLWLLFFHYSSSFSTDVCYSFLTLLPFFFPPSFSQYFQWKSSVLALVHTFIWWIIIEYLPCSRSWWYRNESDVVPALRSKCGGKEIRKNEWYSLWQPYIEHQGITLKMPPCPQDRQRGKGFYNRHPPSRDLVDIHLGDYWKLEIYFWRCHGSNCDKEEWLSSHLLSHWFDLFQNFW